MSETDSPPTKRSKALIVVVVCVAVLAVLAAAGTWLWKSWAAPQHTDSQSQTYDAPISRIEVTGDSGQIDLVASDGDETVVDRSLRWNGDSKPKSQEEWSGETLSISVTGCDRGIFDTRCGIDYRIEVPADVDVKVHNDSGNVTTTGFAGAQQLVVDSGDIEVTDASGTVDVDTDSGDVTANGLSGASVTGTLDSGSAKLTFDKAPENVTVSADSGDVELGLPRNGSYQVKADVDSGDKNIDVDSGSGSRIEVSADSGDVTVRYSD
jgi:hypothetical protein